MSEETTIMDLYYFANRLWIDINAIMIIPFLISCIVRFFNQDINKQLWTDHFARFFLSVSCVFYVFDIYIKYQVDGSDSICEKAFYIHHISSLIILPPLILHRYISWWTCPIGFMHGFCILFPESDLISYIYAGCLFVFQYGIYQEPYSNFKGFKSIQFTMNFIWIFALMLLIGNCSNYLPVGPDS